MQTFAKTFVRRASGPVAAAAVGATTAQARVPLHTQVENVRPISNSKAVEEDWVMTSVNGDKVLFQPFSAEEIDEGVNDIGALIRPFFGSSVVINEVSPDGSDITDGFAADNVIEVADTRNSVAVHRMGANSRQELELSRLLHISSKMLRRPGLQREVVACMLEDPEVRNLMLTQCDDLDAYLLAANLNSPAGLLMPGEGLDSASSDGEGPDLVALVVKAVSGFLATTGGALEFLGHWLRDRFAFLVPHRGTDKDGEGGGTGRQTTDRVLGSVMTLAIALVCMLVIRRPLRFQRA